MCASWQEYRTIKDIEVEVEGQEELTILQAEVEVTIKRDHNYGADADGRQGIVADFIDDWTIESILNVDTGEDVTEQFKNDAKVRAQIRKGL